MAQHDMPTTNGPTESPKTGVGSFSQGPASPTRLLIFGLLALAGGLGFDHWLSDYGHHSFPARLAADVTTLTAPTDAIVSELLLSPGASVKPDDVVVRLQDQALERALVAKQLAVQTLQAELQQAEARSDVEIAWRQRELDSEMFETRLRLADCLQGQLMQNVAALAWEDFRKDRRAVTSTVSDEKLFTSMVIAGRGTDEQRVDAILREEAARNSAEMYAAQVEICETRISELESLRSALGVKVRRANGVDVAQARLNLATEELAALQQDELQLDLKANHFGRVGVYRHEVGDRVVAGDSIADVLDTTERHVVMQVPCDLVNLVSEGREVTLQFAGGEMRRGIIRGIPPQTIGPESIRSDKQIADRSVVMLRVERIGQLWPEVPVGSNVTVLVD